MSRRGICYCNAYPWPHNPGRGKCDAARDARLFYCPVCEIFNPTLDENGKTECCNVEPKEVT